MESEVCRKAGGKITRTRKIKDRQGFQSAKRAEGEFHFQRWNADPEAVFTARLGFWSRKMDGPAVICSAADEEGGGLLRWWQQFRCGYSSSSSEINNVLRCCLSDL